MQIEDKVIINAMNIQGEVTDIPTPDSRMVYANGIYRQFPVSELSPVEHTCGDCKCFNKKVF